MTENKLVYDVPSKLLTDAQRTLVLALARQRQGVVAEANERVAEINAAEMELAELLRQLAGLPEGVYRFEGDEHAVRLVRTVEGK